MCVCAFVLVCACVGAETAVDAAVVVVATAATAATTAAIVVADIVDIDSVAATAAATACCEYAIKMACTRKVTHALGVVVGDLITIKHEFLGSWRQPLSHYS